MESSLSADVVAAIEDLEVAARIVVEGMRAGAHRSPFRGPGSEFQQHRPYRAGDDLRHLDWKLYARSNRLFTRQYRETTDFAVQLIVDTSPSMAYPLAGVSKLQYAKTLAASLCYLVSTAGNAVGLTTWDANGFNYTPPRTSVIHRSALIARLDGAQPTKGWDSTETIRHSSELLKRRGLVIVLSDFYDDEEATLRELRTVARRGHDVIMIQTLSHDELEFDFTSEVELQDLESSQRQLVDANVIRAAYQEGMGAFLARCRDGAGESGIDYALVSTSTPPADALRRLLSGRNA